MTAEVTPAWWTADDAQDALHAIAPGAHTFHTGLMWRPDAGIEPDPESLQIWGAGTFFHSLIRLTLHLDGQPVDFASYHGPPFGRMMRADQAERLLGALTRPSAPLLLGGDMNTVGAARVTSPDGASRWYDPDPYQDVDEWFGDLVYQCDWLWRPDGTRQWWADRRPADILISGGLHDVAAALNAPWHPTTGHHERDDFGQGAACAGASTRSTPQPTCCCASTRWWTPPRHGRPVIISRWSLSSKHEQALGLVRSCNQPSRVPVLGCPQVVTDCHGHNGWL
jgi:hypothetical protein